MIATLLDSSGPLLDYAVVDVFALTAPDGSPRPYTGNPLAVVLGADELGTDGLTTEQCQALAAEFNLSETVFPSASPHADYRARIFMPTGELPFAGHPSVGAAWTLAALGQLAPGRRTQDCAAGIVELEVPADLHGDPAGVRLTGPLPSAMHAVPAGPLLQAVGLTPADLDLPAEGAHPATGGSGVPFAFLPVRPGALARCRPDLAALAALEPAMLGVLAVEIADPSVRPLRLDARMFAADIGEDPATGSAALGLGGWLAHTGLVSGDGTHAYAITQGADMGRPSLLHADVTLAAGRVERVRVSGRVAVVATGRIRVP